MCVCIYIYIYIYIEGERNVIHRCVWLYLYFVRSRSKRQAPGAVGPRLAPGALPDPDINNRSNNNDSTDDITNNA